MPLMPSPVNSLLDIFCFSICLILYASPKSSPKEDFNFAFFNPLSFGEGRGEALPSQNKPRPAQSICAVKNKLINSQKLSESEFTELKNYQNYLNKPFLNNKSFRIR